MNIHFSGRPRVRVLSNTDMHENYVQAAKGKAAMDHFAEEGRKDGYDIIQLNSGDTHTG
jgi:hypothetical protein